MQWIIRDIPLGVNIQKARMKRGLTQEQLIAQMQLHGSTMTRSTLANIEAGTRNIRACDLKLMKKIPAVWLGWAAGSPKQFVRISKAFGGAFSGNEIHCLRRLRHEGAPECLSRS